tara:strand:- start:160 stop:489 length:330 start_codon:yes stop_codon:yes gene_type:complete
MGKKRRIIARGTKFAAKYASHPATRETTATTTTVEVANEIKVIANKVESIEQEIVATNKEAESVIAAKVEQTPVATVSAKPVAKKKTPTTRIKTNTSTKSSRTRKTSKK